MPSIFAGFDIARSALMANQTALEVTGHNVANVNTEGYTRQTVSLVARQPYSTMTTVNPAAAQLGTGVDVAAITSVRDMFLERQLQRITGQASQSDQYSSLLARVQTALSETSGNGLSSALTAFFNAFQGLAQDPSRSDLRASVLQTGNALAQQIRELDKSLERIHTDATIQVGTLVDQANGVAQKIADLNVQIRGALALGQHPNDLEDQRQELVKQLSDLVGAQAHDELDASGKPTGFITVEREGWTIVSGPTANTIPSDFTSSDSRPYLTDGRTEAFSPGGQIGGLTRAAGSVAAYRQSLDQIASTLIQQVNAQHEVGYGLDNITGRPFFAGTGAADIALAPEVANNTDALAAASAPAPGSVVAPGNGDNARAIANIANQAVIGSSTIGSAYAALVTRIGSDAKASQDETTSLAAERQQILTLRNAASGVSLDEELTNMMQYQRSYQSAARLLSTVDSMIQTLLSAVGVG